MSKEKINQALRQLSDALTEEYETRQAGHRVSMEIWIDCEDLTSLADTHPRFRYVVRLEVDTTKEESYGC